jgi:hypothetical protein
LPISATKESAKETLPNDGNEIFQEEIDNLSRKRI